MPQIPPNCQVSEDVSHAQLQVAAFKKRPALSACAEALWTAALCEGYPELTTSHGDGSSV